MIESLPVNKKSFDVKEVGEITEHEYIGSFSCKCVLSLKQKYDMEMDIGKLTDNLKNPSQYLLMLSTVLGELSHKLIDSPSWWKDSKNGLDLLDENIVLKVYSKVVEAETEWKMKIREKSKALAQDTQNQPQA